MLSDDEKDPLRKHVVELSKVICGGTDMNMIELSTTGEPQSRKRGNDEAGEITRRKAATR
jgi:hypothetical protein